MVYHLLPETEPFSEYAGGSLSRWTANVLRAEEARIFCPWADASWIFDRKRILPLRGMRLYGRLLKRRDFQLRIAYRVHVLRWLMRSVVRRLKDGDVLYIHNRPEYLLALPPLDRRTVKFKTVLHMHNDHLADLTAGEYDALRPDLTIFNSSFLAAQGKRGTAMPGQVAVLPNGADEKCFYPPSQPPETQPPIILFAGRLIPEKGVHVLIEAMGLLLADGVPAIARIVGSATFGDDRETAYVQTLHAAAPGNVEFVVYKAGKALADEFRAASVFCCPSTWDEPFGMVNVEAMAAGLPVVATDSGGIPEIFVEGGALLVERNSAPALAAALKRIVQDGSLRRRLAREGYASYQRNFRWSVIAAEYRSLMDGLDPSSPRSPVQHQVPSQPMSHVVAQAMPQQLFGHMPQQTRIVVPISPRPHREAAQRL